jgi:flagellar protein FlgJ
VIGPVTPSAAPVSPERAQLREAAEGFEAIMVRRMLATARAASFAEDTPLTGGGMKQFTAMRDEHLAEIAAQSGGFGFARSIEASLAQHLSARPGEQGNS